MGKKEALRVLISCGTSEIRGCGLGYRSTSEKRREEVRKAIRRLFKDAYDRLMDASDEFNFF